MTHTPHELAAQFPAHAAAIHALKLSDPHFARLSEEYHVLNRSIHRAETNVEPTDDFHMEEMKKRRLLLLDQIKDRLLEAKPPA